MKKLTPLLFSLLFIFSSCISGLKQPEGMPDKAYEKYKTVILDSKEIIKNTKDAFPLQAHIDLAVYSAVLKDNKTAEVEYLKILEIHPQHFVALNNLAVIYEETDRKQEALEYYSKLADAHPEKLEPIKDALRIFKELGRKDDGQKVLEHWATQYPEEQKDEGFFQFVSQMFVFLNDK
jgi:tetratricopeptide (TPR) repeat protein